MANLEVGGSENAGQRKAPRFIDTVYKTTTGEKAAVPEVAKRKENPPPDPTGLFERLSTEDDPTKQGALLIKVVQALKDQVRLRLGDEPGGIYQTELDLFKERVRREYKDEWNKRALMRALIGEKGGFEIDPTGKGLDFPGEFSVINFLGRLKRMAKEESVEEARSMND